MDFEMLAQREELLNKIEAIMESFKFETYDDLYSLEKDICDAVCDTFPCN